MSTLNNVRYVGQVYSKKVYQDRRGFFCPDLPGEIKYFQTFGEICEYIRASQEID